jgi:hypothetical protein
LLSDIGDRLVCSSRNVVGHSPIVLEALSRHISEAMVRESVDATGCREKRRRRLPAADVLWLVLMMGLRSDLNLVGMWRQARGLFATGLDALAGIKPPAKSALSQAKARLGPKPLRRLLCLTAKASESIAGAYYKGMRLKAMDGDNHKIPDTPQNIKAFGRPCTARRAKEQKCAAGYPQIKIIRLIDVGTRTCIEAFAKPFDTSEHHSAIPLLSRTGPGDLTLWDCGFYSAELVRHALLGKHHFLGPAQPQAILKPFENLSDGSFLAKVYATDKHRKADRNGAVVRVLGYTHDDPARINCGKEHRLVTSLLDPLAYPAKELVALYHERWEIEIANDEITTHQLGRPVELRSLTPNGVIQEVYAIYAAHNAVRLLMCEAALAINIDPRTLSFTNSIRLIREHIQAMRDAAACQLPQLYQNLLTLIAMQKLPPRDQRINPRVVKVARPSNFPVKKKHHLKPKQPQKTFIDSVVILI